MAHRLEPRAWKCVAVLAVATLVASLAAPALATADGDLDPTFGGGAGFVHSQLAGATGFRAGSLHVGPVESFTLGAEVVFDGPSEDFAACLFGRNGGIVDCSAFGFDLGGDDFDGARAVAYRLDGSRVLAGFADGTAADPDSRLALLGLAPLDQLDTFFGNNGRKSIAFAGDASALAASGRRNGDVVVVGYYDHDPDPSVENYDCLVGRVHPDGSLDTTFSGNGLATVAWDFGDDDSDSCGSLALYGDGRVVVAGVARRADGQWDMAVARLTADGDLDTTFSGNGKTVIPFDIGGGDQDVASGVALDRTDRIVIAGTVETPGGQLAGVARLRTDGTLDPTFGVGGRLTFGFSATADDIAQVTGVLVLPPPSNDIVVSGIYQPSGQFSGRAFVVALRPGGAFDPAFGSGGRVTFAVPGTTDFLFGGGLALQGGKLLLAGGWARLSAEPGDFWVARLYRDAIFGDDFEGGALRLWSNHADP